MKPEQITAWALDEASTEERQQLEAALLENPQDKQKADETKAFCDFLLSELRDDSLALTDKQRERLVAQASSAAPASPLQPLSGAPPLQAPAPRTTRWNIGVIVRLSLAACAVLGGFWTWQAYSTRQSQTHAVAAVAEKPAIKVQLAPKPEAKKKAGQGPEALLAATPVKSAIVPEQPAAKPLSPMPKSEPAPVANTLALKKDQRAMTPGDVQRLKQVQDEHAYGLDFGGTAQSLPIPNAGPTVVAGTGMLTQKVEPAAAFAAPVLTGGSSQLASSSSVSQSTGSLTLNAGGAVAAAAPTAGAPSRSLSVTPGAPALLQQPQHRPAASLSLKSGFYPSQMVGYALTPDVTKIDGFINLDVPPWQETNGLVVVVGFARRVLVTPQKTGLVSCLLPGTQMGTASGWPLMPQAQPGVIATAVDPDMSSSLADYQPDLAFGDVGLHNHGSASLVLKAAYGSTGNIVVQLGTPFTINAILRHRWPFYAASAISSIGDRYFKGIGIGSPMYKWMPLYPDVNASPGVISFATATHSYLMDPSNAGSISAADQRLLGGLLPRDQFFSGIPANLADASGVSEMRAAVFNMTALSKSSSESAVLGSGAVVVNGGVFGSTGKKQPLDLIGLPVVRAKSGTGATMDETREFYSAGSIEVPNKSNFKFDGSSAAQAGNRGTLILTPAAPVKSTAGVSAPPSGSDPFEGEHGSLSSELGNVSKKLSLERHSLSPTIAHDFEVPSVSFGYSFSHTMGSLANGGGSNHFAGSSRDYGMNDTQQLTLGTTTNLGPVNLASSTNYDMANGGWHYDLPAHATSATTHAVALPPPPAAASASTATAASGTMGQTKIGSGTLVLSGANTYTGGTKVNGGTLTLSGGAAMQTGDGFAPLNTAAAAPASPPVAAMGGSGYAGYSSPPPGVPDPQAAAPMAANTSSSTATPQAGAAGKVQSGLQQANGAAETGDYDAAITQYQNVLRTDPYNAAARRGMEAADKKRQEYFKTAYDNQRAKMLAQVGEQWEDKAPSQGKPVDPVKSDGAQPAGAAAAPMPATSGAAAPALANATTVTATADIPPVELQIVSAADARYLSLDAPSAAAMKDLELEQSKRAFRKTDPTSGETYTRIIENEMKDVTREPLSTLSIDVDTASYANVRRFLNQNMIPPPDAVRIEELVNYFPTSEEGPAHDAKEPFGVRVELAPCPWQPVHRLARIAIKGREMDKNRKPSNLVFLVDVSGSMSEPAKLPLVQQSLRMLTEQLGEGDHVTMVVYAGSSGVVLPPTSGEKKEEILAAIGRLSAGGSTHGSAGIKLAYEQAVAGFIKGGVNRVILCTDGDFNVGVNSPEELEKLIKQKAKTGVFLSVLGFGSGNLKDRTMETLADKGNGNYAYIDSLSEARKVLVEQMGGTLDTIAKDVKIQVEFNPAAVRSYRLIGYENRLLAKEDFNDDTKDAGEIGAGHSVVALYEIVPANLPAGTESRPVVDSLKYQAPAISPAQLAEAAKTGETMTVKLRYKAPDSDLSKLIELPTKDEGKTLTASSDEFKFSAAVAGFGLLLRDSSYKGTLSWETVRRLALDGKGPDKQGYRGEFLQLIDKARGLKETR